MPDRKMKLQLAPVTALDWLTIEKALTLVDQTESVDNLRRKARLHRLQSAGTLRV